MKKSFISGIYLSAILMVPRVVEEEVAGAVLFIP
jgi:hypothetical protein